MEHLDVFVSSTSEDLREHRQAVREAILDLQLYPIMMENLAAEGAAGMNKSRRGMEDAEIFVGIYAKRYGWIPSAEEGGDGAQSLTALEYARAKARGIPMLCFVLDDSHAWPDTAPHIDREPEKAALLADFKAQVKNEVIIAAFTTADNLRALVIAALAHAVRDLTGEERTVGVWRRPVGPSLEYNFVGRDEDQTALTDLLGVGDQPVTVVSGTGGIGKTFLAKHMAHALKEKFPGGVLWVSMGPDARHAATEVPRVLATWARHHRQGRDLPHEQLTPDLVRGLLADAPGRLLAIFDDVWHAAPVQQLRRALPEGTAVLVTTRLARVAALGQRYRLERLNDEDARALIEDRLRAAAIDPEPLRETITQIVGMLQGHALALDLAARQIVSYWRDNAERYAERLRRNLGGDTPFKLLTLGMEEEGTRDDSLEAALFMSYDRLTDDQQAKYRALGVFAPDTSFSQDMVFATWNVDVKNDEALEAAEDTLHALVGAGLVRQRDDQPGRYEQHMLLHTYAGALARREGEYDAAMERYARYVIDGVARQFDRLPPEEWDTRILVDKDHIHHIGDALAGTEGPDGTLQPGLVQALVLGDTLLETLAKPESPDNVDHLRRETVGDAAAPDGEGPRMIAALIQRGSDFVVAVKSYVFFRRISEGLRWLQMGLACTRLASDQQRESLLVGQLGAWYQQRGEVRASLAYQEAGLALDRALGNQHNEAVSLNNIGSIYDDLGDKQRALEYYERALPIQRAVGDRVGEAVTLNNIGGVHSELGDLQRALEYYEEALPIRREVGDRAGEAVTLGNIGGVYRSLNELPRALDYYERALPLIRAVGNRAGEATTLNNIGMVYDALGDKQRALEYFEQALPIRREVGAKAGESVTLNNIGGVYNDLGEYPRALEYYEQALALIRAVGDKYQEAVTCYNIGVLLHNAFGRTAEAIQYLERCVQLDAETGHPDLESDRAMLERLRRGERGETAPVPPMNAQNRAIADAIVAYVNTPDWDAARAQVEAHQDLLLTDTADQLFEVFIAEADDPKIKEMLEDHRMVLRMCREQGVEAAFQELESGGGAASGRQMSAQETAIFNAVNALGDAQNLEELRAQVEAHAGVLFPAVADQFLASEIPQQSDPQIRQALEFIRELLRMCRELGVDEAFRRLEAGGTGGG